MCHEPSEAAERRWGAGVLERVRRDRGECDRLGPRVEDVPAAGANLLVIACTNILVTTYANILIIACAIAFANTLVIITSMPCERRRIPAAGVSILVITCADIVVITCARAQHIICDKSMWCMSMEEFPLQESAYWL